MKDDRIHRFTPSVTAQDSRALTVRNVSYLRAVAGAEAEALITRQRHNAAGRQTEQWDPRLSDAGTTPNIVTAHTLSGAPLSVDSVDAGWRLSLPGMAGQSLERWDARGNHWLTTYDEQLRVLNDATDDQSSVETFTYADASADSRHNRRGQMTVLNDPSGALKRQSFSLLGGALEQSRSFESAEAYCSRQSLSPLNEVLTQTDAGGHCQLFRHDIAGQIKQVALLRQGASAAQVILQTAHYNAAGQIVERVAGNQLVSHWRYDPANDWLVNAQAGVTGQPFVQDFAYAYDAVGNVEYIDDHTFTPVYFANRLIDGQRAFRYDSLYRLTSASGHDAACATDLPGHPSPSDPNDLHNYTQHFEYDRANNLIKFVHGRAINGYTRQMQIAPSSNRALRWQDDDPPPDFAAAFDAHGNQRRLGHGPQLVWNAKDQLHRITLLEHGNGLPDDQEIYLYSQGERVSKRHETHSPAVAHFQRVRYLPGLEIRTRDNGEELHVITLPDNVRCLHWRSAPPTDVENNQLRYSLGDHLGSSTMELDQQGQVLSQETYYPFGGTATWLPYSKSAGDYKTIRYSGKEMDVSGLYYYGARYYAPWLQRWVSADPAGDVDGLNVYVMVVNNPITNIDSDGRANSKFTDTLVSIAGFTSEANRFAEEFDDEDNLLTPEQRANTTFTQYLSKKSGIGALARGSALGGAAGTSIAYAVTSAVPALDMSYIGPIVGMASTYVGGHAYSYIRYRFFRSNVRLATTLHLQKAEITARRLAEMAQGVVPTGIQNQLANMQKDAMSELTAAIQSWSAVDRLRFTIGTPANESVTAFVERYEDFKKTMTGGTTELVEPDNESLAGVSTISGSLNDFASAAGDSVQADNSWWTQFKGFFKRDKTPNQIPMDSFA